MKVLQTRSAFEDNGPGTQALTIARELRNRGHEVEFLACGGALQSQIEEAGFPFHVVSGFRYGERGPLKSLQAIKAIARVLKDRKIELVHGHNATSVQLAYFAGLRNGRRLPLVQSVRGVELRRWFQWRNWIYRTSPAQLLAVCDFTKQTLVGFGVPEDRVTITYNGIDPKRFNPETVDNQAKRREFELDGKLVVGHIGAMRGLKGQEVLVEAVSRVKGRFPNVVAVLVGDGQSRELVERRTRELGVEDRIRFAGMRFESPEFHAAFDIYAQPSTQGEMFPNSIVEAMSMCKPWIGSDISGLSELTANGQAGWVTAPGDVDALSSNLAKLLESEELRRERGLNGYREVHERFTIQRVVSRVEAVYEKALGNNKHADRRAA